MKALTENLVEEIIGIGNKVAVGWGASCYDFETFPRKKEVTFHCVEHGEFFVTTLSYANVKKEYKYDIEEKCRGYKAKRIETKAKENESISGQFLEDLLEIGNDVASGWGRDCFDVELDVDEKDNKTPIVRFMCYEHGESFYTELTYEEIKRTYKYDVEKKTRIK